MRRTRLLKSLASITAVTLLAACGGTESPTDPDPDPEAPTGSVSVTVATSGQDQDSQYSVTVAGSTQILPGNGGVTFATVAVGAQTVTISGVATNCAVTGSNSQVVTVSAGLASSVSFTVTCTAIPNANDLLAEAIDSLEVAMYATLNISDLPDLDTISFAMANSLFDQALAAAPSNDTAAFGVAVTTIFMLEDDPGMRAAADQWKAWVEEGPDPVGPMPTLFAPATPLTWGRTTLPLEVSGVDVLRLARSGLAATELARAPTEVALAPPPSITAHQALLSNVVAPTLRDALDALLQITDAGFVFTVTPAMQGELPINADPLELDYTEVLAIQAGIEVALASIDIVTAYTLVPNPASVSGFVTAMTPGSTFLTLKSGGAAALSDALTRLVSAADILLDGLDALEAEADGQDDDIIKYDPTGSGDGLTATDITDARNTITDVKDALSTPTSVTLNEGDLDEFTFQLDAREFFVDPVQDFKALLPPYEVGSAMEESETVVLFRWTDLNVSDWTFPDVTFSGMLPGMTQQNLVEDLGAGGLFFDLSLVGGFYQLITVDGQDCLDTFTTTGFGCTVNSGTYIDGSLDIDGFDGTPVASLNLSGTPYSFAYGPYTVVDNAGDIEITLDLVDDSLSPLTLTAAFTDNPGYTSYDSHGRERGGSLITIDWQGETWIFEKQP